MKLTPSFTINKSCNLFPLSNLYLNKNKSLCSLPIQFNSLWQTFLDTSIISFTFCEDNTLNALSISKLKLYVLIFSLFLNLCKTFSAFTIFVPANPPLATSKSNLFSFINSFTLVNEPPQNIIFVPIGISVLNTTPNFSNSASLIASRLLPSKTTHYNIPIIAKYSIAIVSSISSAISATKTIFCL